MHLRVLAIAGLFGLLPGIASPQESTAGAYTIAGLVVQHLSDRPLKNVRLTLTRNSHPDQQLFVMTAEDGKFSFTNLPSDKYSLAAEYRGVTRLYQQHEQFSTGIAVGPGLDSEHILFVLPAPTGLNVTVLDDEGEPVNDAQLFLFQKKVAYGWEQMMLGTRGSTDSSGSHRFTRLEPGTYLLAVEAQPWYAQHQPGQGEQLSQQPNAVWSELDVAYPLTYYPGVLDAPGAAPIVLSEGNTAHVEITLHAVPALHVAISSPAPNESTMPQFSNVGPGGLLLPWVLGYSTSNTNGQQELLGVPPGHYQVSVMRFHGGPNPGGPEMLGVAQTDLGSSNSRIDASALVRTGISGKISFEEAQRPANAVLWFSNVRNGQASTAQVKEDGSFEVDNSNGVAIAAGPYEIRIVNMPGLYIKSIAVKGMNYSDGVLEVQEGASAQITMVIARGEVEVKGIALQDGKPFSGAMVLLVPKDRNQSTFIPRDQSDSDGTFELQGAHPGRYTLIAIDDGSDLAYQEPGALALYLAGGQAIDVPLADGAPAQANVQKRVR